MWAINDNLENQCIEFKDVIENHFKLKMILLIQLIIGIVKLLIKIDLYY